MQLLLCTLDEQVIGQTWGTTTFMTCTVVVVFEILMIPYSLFSFHMIFSMLISTASLVLCFSWYYSLHLDLIGKMHWICYFIRPYHHDLVVFLLIFRYNLPNRF